MKKTLRGKLNYANLISSFCLFLLLSGGAAYAATQLPKNSVGSKQIKKGAITPAKLSKAAKATLTGPKGATGATGPLGNPGTPGSGLPPSASASVANNLALTGTLAPIVQANITTTQQSRIEETTLAIFNTTASGTITCQARIEPQAGGVSSMMSNAITVDTKSGSTAEGTAGGAIIEPAGSFTVSVNCSTTGAMTVTSADMNVITGAP